MFIRMARHLKADKTQSHALLWALGRAGETLEGEDWVSNSTAYYPGGSRARVTRAGQAVREGKSSLDDLVAIDVWRAAHQPVPNTFQAMLRARAKGQDVVVAQRHKRKLTIFDKLRRFPKMELARMDDIAGCRLIFPDIKSLHDFRSQFHNAKFKHRRRNGVEKYDYIERPKATGYRGIHDVYEYDANSEKGRPYKGLFIELQVQNLCAACLGDGRRSHRSDYGASAQISAGRQKI